MGDQAEIEKLDLSNNKIDFLEYDFSSDRIFVYLKYLYLDGNRFKSNVYKNMAEFLSKSSRLHTVSLRNCGVPDKACELLFPFLSCRKKLKLVDLSQNEITNKGVIEICNIMDELCRPFLLK